MPFPVKRVHFGNYVFNVWENVYEPAEDSLLFAENLDVEKGSQVLDVGTGCGMLGVLAAEKAGNVVAIDLNPYAVCCARENAALNNLRCKLAFIQTDLLTALNESARFDLILLMHRISLLLSVKRNLGLGAHGQEALMDGKLSTASSPKLHYT